MEHKFTNDTAKKIAAFETLQSLGYTWQGGQLWKPPLGQPPAYIAWDGEGLPPVGAAIEYSTSRAYDFGRVWHKAVVKYVSESNFVFTDDEGLESVIDTEGCNIQYRPIMTAQERYEHRKAKAVKAMMDIYDAPSSIELSNRERMEIIFAAIAAGDIAGVTALKDDE